MTGATVVVLRDVGYVAVAGLISLLLPCWHGSLSTLLQAGLRQLYPNRRIVL